MSRRSTYILYRPSTRQSAVCASTGTAMQRARMAPSAATRSLSARSCAVVTRSSRARSMAGRAATFVRRRAASRRRDTAAGSVPVAARARSLGQGRADWNRCARALAAAVAPAYTAAMPPLALADAIPAAIPRAALVTGGAKRLGRAICLGLAEAGFDVALHYGSSAADAEATAEAIRAAWPPRRGAARGSGAGGGGRGASARGGGGARWRRSASW